MAEREREGKRKKGEREMVGDRKRRREGGREREEEKENIYF